MEDALNGAYSTRLFLGTAAILLSTAVAAQAANTPCSGRKGGIAGCQGDTFICNDGSVSASKRSCSAYMGGAVGLLGGGSPQMAPTVGADCSCRSGAYCTGPRGGRYCMTDGGQKSYLRK
ncbi:hypothetical protein [Rhizobium leguminosarum]|uniref:YdcA family protein n=1 Tax=Rhizobium leguminosarum TaxID=384 RepID=UPI0028F446CA|nr:hypothetical protein [Rhizobium leguminosarum]